MGAAAWANHLLCSGYGQGIIAGFAREARHRPRQAHMAATQWCWLRESVRRPSAVHWYTCTSAGTPPPEGFQELERMSWNHLRVVKYWDRNSGGRWSSNMEQTPRLYLRAFWDANTLDNSRHRSRERLPGQHTKCTVVSRRRPCQPTIESHPVPISHCARFRWHILRCARKHNRAGRDRWHGRCWPNSGVHWDDAEPHTAKDLDLPTVPAGTFSSWPAARTATSAWRVEAGAGGLGCVAQEVLGRKALSRVCGDETQRRVHQSTMETGNIPRLQRMHRAEARGRNTI